MSWLNTLPKHIDDETGLEFAVIKYGRKYVHVKSNDLFEKDWSGQWWIQAGDGSGERGPFNSLEHACDCSYERYEG